MRKNRILFFTLILFFGFKPPHQFPQFELNTVEGKKLNNDCFKNKKSIVILAHLGCPPAMVLLRDIQKRRDLFNYQLIFILENTKEQVLKFNSDIVSIWSKTRKQFEMMPITENVIAECSTEKISYRKGNIIIDSQCRKMSKKLKTKSSPSIYFVNEMGEIYRSVFGYPVENTLEQRVKSFLKD
jgi:hypothetical protein